MNRNLIEVGTKILCVKESSNKAIAPGNIGDVGIVNWLAGTGVGLNIANLGPQHECVLLWRDLEAYWELST